MPGDKPKMKECHVVDAASGEVNWEATQKDFPVRAESDRKIAAEQARQEHGWVPK